MQKVYDFSRPENRENTRNTRNDRNDRNNYASKKPNDFQNMNVRQNNYSKFDVTKMDIINYVYSSCQLANYKYTILENENQLELFKGKYHVSINYAGYNNLLVFVKIREKYYSYLIDKKKLRNNKNEIDMESLRLTKVKVPLDNTIYHGTIFDGTFIEQNNTYIITDAYQFRGNDVQCIKLKYKMLNINAYIEQAKKMNYDNLDNTEVLNLVVGNLYEICDTDKVIKQTIPREKTYPTKGIAFYPEISGTKLVYFLHDKKSEEIIDDNEYCKNNIHDAKVFTQNNVQIKKNDIVATFELKKTQDADVYKIFLSENIEENGRTLIKSKKMGIAYIPNIECSLLCCNIFEKNPNMRILMKCKYIVNKQKWQPYEHNKNVTFPSNYSEISHLISE
jgi:hypothetical protein